MVHSPHIVAVRVEARDFWCEGDVAIPAPGGYKGRVLDVLKTASEFIALTDVELHRRGDSEGTEPLTYDVLLLRKAEIEYVIPLD